MASSIPGFSKFGAAISNPYVLAGAAVVGAAIGIGVVTADLANKFQKSTNQMAANAGITIGAANQIGDAFLTTGGKTTFSAQQMMSAYAPVAGQLALTAGHALSATDSMTFMAAAMNLAEATGQPLTSTVAGLAQVMQAYAIPVAQAAAATDLLTNVSHGLGMPVGDLVGAVDKLHAKLGPLAPSLNDVGTLLTDVASHGLTGSRALMLVSTGMNTLLAGSKPTSAELKTLGMNIFDANGKFVGMSSVLGQLSPKLATMTEAQRLAAEKALFGAGASKALDDTIMAGLPGWDKAAAAATKTGTAQAGAVTATSGLSGSFDKLKGAVTDIGIALGQKLQPIFATVMQAFSTAAQWLATNLPAILNRVGIVFGVMKDIIGAVMDRVITILSIWVDVVRAIIERVVVIIEIAVGIIQPVVNRIGVIFGVVASVVGAAIGTVITVISGIVSVITGVVKTVIGVVTGIIAFFVNLPGNIGNALGGFGGKVAGFFTTAFTTVTSTISGWIGTAVKFFADLPGKMGKAFIAFGGDLAQGMKNVINAAIINPINNAIRFIGDLGGSIGPVSVHIRDAFGGHMPSIPTLDSGGIISRPTLALLAANSQPEAVIPLNQLVRSSGGGGTTHATYVTINVSGDPNAVVAALKQWMYQNGGSIPITVNAARRLGAA